MRYSMKTLIALIFGLLFVAGCGQKAPLYLPGDPGTLTTEIPGQQDSVDTDEEDDEDDN